MLLWSIAVVLLLVVLAGLLRLAEPRLIYFPLATLEGSPASVGLAFEAIALRTADAVGNVQVWITNEHLHDGLRVAGDTILPRLVDLLDGVWSVTGR